MGKPFDATTKHLIEAHPADWLALAGLPTGTAVRVVDADLSSFTLAADKLVRVEGPDPYVSHIELQSGPDRLLDRRVLMYNAVVGVRHELPVRSVVFLLRPAALSPANTGQVRDVADPACRLEFNYRLVRVWELPPSAVLAGGLGTLPLAPITAVVPADLPAVFGQVAARLDREAAPAHADELWAATYILSGLRHPPELVGPIMRGVRGMKESLTYQAIVAEGKAEGLAEGERRVLIRLGTKKFGPPDAGVLARLRAMNDVDRLAALADRLLDATGWDELLKEGE